MIEGILGVCLGVSLVCNILLMRGGLKLQAKAQRLEHQFSNLLAVYQRQAQEWAMKLPVEEKA